VTKNEKVAGICYADVISGAEVMGMLLLLQSNMFLDLEEAAHRGKADGWDANDLQLPNLRP
jgi:hypothetical protein